MTAADALASTKNGVAPARAHPPREQRRGFVLLKNLVEAMPGATEAELFAAFTSIVHEDKRKGGELWKEIIMEAMEDAAKSMTDN